MVCWQLINCQYNTDFWLFWRKCNISEKIFKFPIAKWWQSCYIYYVIKINNGLITEIPRLKPCSLKSPLALTREAQLIWLTKQTLTSGSMQICLRVCAVTLKIFQLIFEKFWKKSVDRIKNNFYIWSVNQNASLVKRSGKLKIWISPFNYGPIVYVWFRTPRLNNLENLVRRQMGLLAETTRLHCLERATKTRRG